MTLTRGPYAEVPLEELPDWLLYQLVESPRTGLRLTNAVGRELERRAVLRGRRPASQSALYPILSR
jgi:hypothetical protein